MRKESRTAISSSVRADSRFRASSQLKVAEMESRLTSSDYTIRSELPLLLAQRRDWDAGRKKAELGEEEEEEEQFRKIKTWFLDYSSGDSVNQRHYLAGEHRGDTVYLRVIHLNQRIFLLSRLISPLGDCCCCCSLKNLRLPNCCNLACQTVVQGRIVVINWVPFIPLFPSDCS